MEWYRLFSVAVVEAAKSQQAKGVVEMKVTLEGNEQLGCEDMHCQRGCTKLVMEDGTVNYEK